MILGVGTDIVAIPRVAKVLQRFPQRFTDKILAPIEQRETMDAAYVAKRFAAKEAALKALGTGLRGGIQWTDLQVLNDALGKPQLKLQGAAAALAAQRGVTQLHVSLSDERDYALAFVILEGESS